MGGLTFDLVGELVTGEGRVTADGCICRYYLLYLRWEVGSLDGVLNTRETSRWSSPLPTLASVFFPVARERHKGLVTWRLQDPTAVEVREPMGLRSTLPLRIVVGYDELPASARERWQPQVEREVRAEMARKRGAAWEV